MKHDSSMKSQEIMIRSMINQRYTPTLLSRIGAFFEDAVVLFVVIIAIIFRPMNILCGGMIAIVIMLLW